MSQKHFGSRQFIRVVDDDGMVLSMAEGGLSSPSSRNARDSCSCYR